MINWRGCSIPVSYGGDCDGDDDGGGDDDDDGHDDHDDDHGGFSDKLLRTSDAAEEYFLHDLNQEKNNIWEVYNKFIIINGINCSPTSPCTALRCKRMVYQWFACIARHSLT